MPPGIREALLMVAVATACGPFAATPAATRYERVLSVPFGSRAESVVEEVRLVVSPHVSHDPGAFHVTAIVEPDVDNRSVTLTVESAAFLASSTIPIDGDAGPRVVMRTFRRLPPGKYLVEVRVARADGSSAACRDEVKVVGSRVGDSSAGGEL